MEWTLAWETREAAQHDLLVLQFPLSPAGFHYLCVTSLTAFPRTNPRTLSPWGMLHLLLSLMAEKVVCSILLKTLCYDIENLALSKLVSFQGGNPFMPSAVHSRERKMLVQLLK